MDSTRIPREAEVALHKLLEIFMKHDLQTCARIQGVLAYSGEMGFTVVPQKMCTHLNPRTYEWDLIWKQGLFCCS
jgi:hypothetical protein